MIVSRNETLICVLVDSGGISGLLGNTVGTAGGLLDGTAGIAGNSLNLVTGRGDPFPPYGIVHVSIQVLD